MPDYSSLHIKEAESKLPPFSNENNLIPVSENLVKKGPIEFQNGSVYEG